jgi:hypothetical protein
MITAFRRHRRRKISKRSSGNATTKVLTPSTEHNELSADGPAEALTPNNSASKTDAELLGTLSLADFDEMLQVAKPLPDFSLDGALRGEHEDEIYGVILRLVASRFGGPFALLLNSASGLAQANVLRIYRAAVVSVLVKIGCFFEELASIPKPAATIPADRSNQRFALLTAFLPMCAFVLGPGGQLNREPLDRLLDAANLAPALFERLRELLKRVDDVGRFRRCAFTKCGGAFYAKYSTSLCCSRRHNNGRLQREWYKKHGKSAVAMRTQKREPKKSKGA